MHVPEGFKELSEQLEYMNTTLLTELPELQTSMDINKNKLMYLFSVTSLSENHMLLNSTTFTWPIRIISILQQHDQIIGVAKSKAEESLQDRRMKFVQEMDEIQVEVEELKNVSEMDTIPFYLKKTQVIQKQLATAQETVAAFNREEQLYGWPLTTYPQRKQILATVEPFANFYSTTASVQKSLKKWMEGSILEIDAETIEAELDQYKRDVYKHQALLSALPTAQELSARLTEKLTDFAENLPLIQIFCNAGMRDRHWTLVSERAGFEIKPDPTYNLKKVLKMELESLLGSFENIADSASKEYTLEKNLSKMRLEWDPLQFMLLVYRESGTMILAGVDEIQQLLDDQIVKTLSMKNSPYIKPFEVQCKNWEARLVKIQEIIDEWLKVQATWLYLEPIFSSDDIMSQMPEEGRKFRAVDASWRQMIKRIDVDRHILVASEDQNLLPDLQLNNTQLEEILKGLNTYLEIKRQFFPR